MTYRQLVEEQKRAKPPPARLLPYADLMHWVVEHQRDLLQVLDGPGDVTARSALLRRSRHILSARLAKLNITLIFGDTK